MSLIYDLINVLTEEEAQKLQTLEVRGKEKKLLDILLKNRHKSEPTNACLLEQLNTTAANCDKLKSYLLLKSYAHLVPDGGIALLNFLARKNYVNHLFYRETLRIEKELQKKGDFEEMKNFYRQVFFLMIGVKFQDFRPELARKFANRLIQLSNDVNDEIFVEAKLLWTEVNGAGITASIKKEPVKKSLIQKIEAFEAKAVNVKSFEARYQTNYIWQWFHALTDEVALALSRCEQNLELLSEAGAQLPPNYLLNTTFKYAEMLYFNDRFEDAFRHYQKLFFHDYPERLKTEIYHIAKFVQVCIVTENFHDGLRALEHYVRHAKPALDSSNVITLLHNAKILMASGQIDIAYNHVLKARSIINKNVYIQYEIELRNLENAYFYLRGERKFAVALARKNLKFLRSKAFTRPNDEFAYFYQLIIAFYNHQEKGMPLSTEHEKMLEHYNHASFAQYGYLLKKMLNNCNKL